MERLIGGLTSKGVCELIKVGKQHNVKRILIKNDEILVEYSRDGEDFPPPPPVSYKAPSEIVKYDQNEELAKLKQDEIIEQIKLTDPDLYEQMLADGEIEDLTDGEDA